MRVWKSWIAVSLALAAAFPGAARAGETESEPIATDRPDITETGSVVGPGRFQIETGFLWERRNGRRSERAIFTPTLFRLGLSELWELRLETDGYSRVRTSGPGSGRTSGYSPLAPGFKYQLSDPPEGSRRPSLAAIGHLNVPSGSSEFATDRITGDLKLAADFDLAPRWSLGVNVGLAVGEDDEGEVFTFGLLTASLGRELNDRLRTYVELAFSSREAASSGQPALILDGGFAYLLNRDTQIDFGIGTGLAGSGPPDLFWTVGFSKRF